MTKISVAIPTYNSAPFILDALRCPLADPRVDDIVLSDDASSDLPRLRELVTSLASSKIRLVENPVNAGGCHNKAVAASHARNDWIILLDSDNHFGPDYLDALYRETWNKDTIYCPASGMSLPHYSWSDFSHEDIDLEIFRRYVNKQSTGVNRLKRRSVNLFLLLPGFLQRLLSAALMMKRSTRFLALMNDGNFLVHRESYLQVHRIADEEGIDPVSADTIFVNYNWLKAHNKLRVVPDMKYYHTVHSGSYWVRTAQEYERVVAWIVNDLQERG